MRGLYRKEPKQPELELAPLPQIQVIPASPIRSEQSSSMGNQPARLPHHHLPQDFHSTTYLIPPAPSSHRSRRRHEEPVRMTGRPTTNFAPAILKGKRCPHCEKFHDYPKWPDVVMQLSRRERVRRWASRNARRLKDDVVERWFVTRQEMKMVARSALGFGGVVSVSRN